MTPADQRSVDAAIALSRRPLPTVAGHTIGYHAGPQLIWIEGHAGSKDRLAHDAELPQKADRLRESLAELGIHTCGPARVSRLDTAVTQKFAEPLEGCAVLQGLALLNVPRCKPLVIGRPPETVGLININGKRTLARSYDWGLHRKTCQRGTIVRMEAQDRFSRKQQSSAEDVAPGFAKEQFRKRFVPVWQAAKGMTVAGYPVLLRTMEARLRRGEMNSRQCERMAGYLVMEMAGVAGSVYPRSSFYRRRAELRDLGFVLADDLMEPVSVDISAVLEQALETECWGTD